MYQLDFAQPDQLVPAPALDPQRSIVQLDQITGIAPVFAVVK